jgi:transposase
VLEGGKPLVEVAAELGASTGQLSTWRTEHLAAGSADALAARKAEAAEMQRLKRENKRLEDENLILRKAAAVFAKGGRVTAKYAFVSAERANHAVATLCRVVGVGVSGVSAWLHAIPAAQSRAEVRHFLRKCRGSRTARPHRPHLRDQAPSLRLAADPRRAALWGMATRAGAWRG